MRAGARRPVPGTAGASGRARRARAAPGARDLAGTTTDDPGPDGLRRDPPPVPGLLRRARPHAGAQRQPAARRPDPAVRQRRHGAVQAVLPRPGHAALRARDKRPEGGADPGHRGGRAGPLGMPRSSRWRATSPSATTSRPARSPSRGSCSPASVADGGYGFPEERLWVTVLDDDDEAIDIWHRAVGVPLERIQRRGLAGQLLAHGRARAGWALLGDLLRPRPGARPRRAARSPTRTATSRSGTSSSCSPSSPRCAAKVDFDIRGDLPDKNIDTGMGLERMAALLQGVDNIYEIDTTRHILDRAMALSGARYGADHRTDVDLRVVADHARTCAFLIGDGVLPGNEGRGYVLRRILRRVVQKMRLLGAHDPAMGELMGAAIEAMGPQYPELGDRRRSDHLDRGRRGGLVPPRPSDAAPPCSTPPSPRCAARAARSLPGDRGVRAARHVRLPVRDHAGDGGRRGRRGRRGRLPPAHERAAGAGQGRRAGPQGRAHPGHGLPRGDGLRGHRPTSPDTTEVVERGHAARAARGRPRGARSPGPGRTSRRSSTAPRSTPRAAGRSATRAASGWPTAPCSTCTTCSSRCPGLFVHRATVADGEALIGAGALGEVDVPRRLAISRAHTATHMIHKAFREILGETATQMGSENSPGPPALRLPEPGPGAQIRDGRRRGPGEHPARWTTSR